MRNKFLGLQKSDAKEKSKIKLRWKLSASVQARRTKLMNEIKSFKRNKSQNEVIWNVKFFCSTAENSKKQKKENFLKNFSQESLIESFSKR